MQKLALGLLMTHLFMRMADEGEGYGYGADEDGKVSTFAFGLNENVKLKKFEWIPNGGKDGAEQEALEIIFDINGTERSYRQFPIVKAFGKNREEITDPNSQEMKDARAEFNARMTHLMHAYVDDAVLKQALAKRISNFKEFCNILRSLLPKNTPELPIDIFMQYQWQPSAGQNRTFLDIPTKRKHGAFIVKHVEPVGSWKPVVVENAQDNELKALKYVDDAGNEHPFTRTGWFMNSNFAKMFRAEGDSNSSSNQAAGAAMNYGTTSEPSAPSQEASQPTTPSTW